MDQAAREVILELAQTAPSVDNAQPFDFQWRGAELLVYRDAGRDRQRGNAGYTISMVGLGCLLECIVIAASGEGLSAEVRTILDFNHPERHWAMISFNSDPPSSLDDLLPGLALRASDRRAY